jgi:hypothetical protein
MVTHPEKGDRAAFSDLRRKAKVREGKPVRTDPKQNTDSSQSAGRKKPKKKQEKGKSRGKEHQ